MTVDREGLRGHFQQELREHKGQYIFQGTVFIILGILANDVGMAGNRIIP